MTDDQASPTPGPNAERMRQFIDQVQAGGRVELVDEFVHPDFVNHTAMAAQGTNRNGVTVAVNTLHQAFSGFRVEVLSCVGEGDTVAVHKVFRGTHTGDWFGLPASGRDVEFTVMDFTRFGPDGRWTDHWSTADALTLLRQVGVQVGQ